MIKLIKNSKSIIIFKDTLTIMARNSIEFKDEAFFRDWIGYWLLYIITPH